MELARFFGTLVNLICDVYILIVALCVLWRALHALWKGLLNLWVREQLKLNLKVAPEAEARIADLCRLNENATRLRHPETSNFVRRRH
jgi:hypothetical protein